MGTTVLRLEMENPQGFLCEYQHDELVHAGILGVVPVEYYGEAGHHGFKCIRI